MCVYICVSVFVCVFVCIYARIDKGMQRLKDSYQKWIHKYKHSDLHTCVCVYVRVCVVCVGGRVCVCIPEIIMEDVIKTFCLLGKRDIHTSHFFEKKCAYFGKHLPFWVSQKTGRHMIKRTPYIFERAPYILKRALHVFQRILLLSLSLHIYICMCIYIHT